MPDQATLDVFAPIWAERDAKYAAEEAARVREEERIREAIRQGRIAAQAEEDRIDAERRAKELITFIAVDDAVHIKPANDAPIESRENGQISERDRRRAANRAYLRARVQSRYNFYGS